MKSNSISVIVPAFNTTPSLGRCLESILSQDLRPTQVIVINDGSTDNTAEVAKGYGNNIIYLEQENMGPAAARNAGLRAANGEFVAFLDADDYWLPNFLKTCVGFLEKNPETIAVSTGQFIKLWGQKDLIRPPILAKPDSQKPKKAFVLEDFFGFWAEQNHITTGSNLIRRDVIEKAGYQLADLRVTEDLEYWGYLATYGKWGFIPEPLFVSDGMTATAAQGWMAKHRIRWLLCPTVEQWQRRIVPRLKEKDWRGFRIVRSRLAQGKAHDNILAGKYSEALATILKYGESFPCGYISKIMVKGVRLGTTGWKICCYMLRFREYLKAILIAITR